MQPHGLPILADWQNFFMILGTAAATLTGLMFVVITLIAGIEVQVQVMNVALSAFNTPTVAHFCAVLLLAVVVSAPWPNNAALAGVLALVGLGAVLYMLTVIRHMRRMPFYRPPLRDWLWYVGAPLSAYLVLIGAAAGILADQALAVYIVAAVMLALLFTSIRNAWDLLTYLAIDRAHPETPDPEPEEGA